MNINKSIQNYLDELSSSSPTPGGGNVSALCGALAASLGTMVCNLTLGKKKYADVENEIKLLSEELSEARNKFLDLAEKDNAAFDKVMEAFKLPKETEEEKNTRQKEIEDATFKAAVVPSDVIHLCANVIEKINKIAIIGNQNSVSDAGVALSLLSTAAQGAYLNVLINCTSMSNQTIGSQLLQQSEILLNEVTSSASSGIKNIVNKLSKQ